MNGLCTDKTKKSGDGVNIKQNPNISFQRI